MSGLTGGFGSGTNIFGNTAPGTVDTFSAGVLSQNTGSAIEAMQNRYSQLGLSGNPQGGTPQSAAASGTSLQSGGAPTTAEAMDIGTLPSLTGGIEGMAEATMGQMQNNALNKSSGGGGGKGGGGGGLGGLGSIAGLAAK